MSNTPTKKSVFDRIGGSSSSGTTNISNKSTHGFCNAFVKSGTCPLGETCKYIHEQPNVDKQLGSKDEMRITKTITRVVDMSSPPIKSTITFSNEQRASNSIQSTRTVVESVNTTSTEHSDRRLSGSDRKQSQSRTSDSKTKSSSKKKVHSSSHETRHSFTKKPRSNDGDSPVSSASESEYTHKNKKKSDSHSTSSSSKHKKHPSISPNRDTEETLNDQLIRQSQTYNKSPKRTIVITERKPEENSKRISKNSKSKSNPDIEFLGSKKIIRDKKSIETIHQQAENPKKSIDVKRERNSPSKSISSDQPRRYSSSTNEKILQIKTEHPSNKTQNSSERTAQQSTPPIVQLSPTPEGSVILPNEPDKSTSVQPSSPICVILDDDSSPAPSIEKKIVRQTTEKKSNENEKNNSKQNKRSFDSDKNPTKEKSNEHSETKRKRLNDGSSTKVTSSSKSGNESRSTSNRSDSRRSANNSREESSSRKYKDRSESKTSRNNDSKDRNLTVSKSRNNTDRRDITRSSQEKKRSTHRRGKEKENVTDSEEHLDEPILPKQTAIEAYMSMDWSLLSRDKRIPLNTQVTSRVVHNNNSVSVCERLLTDEQKEKLNDIEHQSFPLTNFVKQLQNKSTSSIVQSCQRRFGSCAKDMLDMRHKWFTRSIEPVQQYEFINKDHYIAFQQAINSLLDKTSTDMPIVQIETTTADVLLS